MTRRVVITGMGTVNPARSDVHGLLARPAAPAGAASAPIEQFDTTAFKVQFGGEVKDFKPETLPRQQDGPPAGPLRPVRPGRRHRGRQGQRPGLRQGRPLPLRRHHRQRHRRPQRVRGAAHPLSRKAAPASISPFVIPKMIANAAPGNISIQFGLCGPNTAVSTACASAGQRHRRRLAHHPARRGRRDGHRRHARRPSRRWAWAASSRPAPCRSATTIPQARQPALRQGPRRLRPQRGGRHRRPRRTGARPQARRARIYAELLGCGSTADAHHITAPHP